MWRTRDEEGDSADGPRIRPQLVTVSYNEAARLLDGGEQVDAVPLPAAIRDWMQPFVAEHYRPEPKRKSRRNEFYERVANMSPALLKAFWSKIIFTGRGLPPQAVANSVEAKKFVMANLNTIGYIDRSMVDGDVKVVLAP